MDSHFVAGRGLRHRGQFHALSPCMTSALSSELIHSANSRYGRSGGKTGSGTDNIVNGLNVLDVFRQVRHVSLLRN